MGALGRLTRDELSKVPIRAASDQGEIHAFVLGAEQWAKLKMIVEVAEEIWGK